MIVDLRRALVRRLDVVHPRRGDPGAAGRRLAGRARAAGAAAARARTACAQRLRGRAAARARGRSPPRAPIALAASRRLGRLAAAALDRRRQRRARRAGRDTAADRHGARAGRATPSRRNPLAVEPLLRPGRDRAQGRQPEGRAGRAERRRPAPARQPRHVERAGRVPAARSSSSRWRPRRRSAPRCTSTRARSRRSSCCSRPTGRWRLRPQPRRAVRVHAQTCAARLLPVLLPLPAPLRRPRSRRADPGVDVPGRQQAGVLAARRGGQDARPPARALGVDRLRVSVFWVAVAPDADTRDEARRLRRLRPRRLPAGATGTATTRSSGSPPRAGSAIMWDVTGPAPNWATGKPTGRGPTSTTPTTRAPRSSRRSSTRSATRYSGSFIQPRGPAQDGRGPGEGHRGPARLRARAHDDHRARPAARRASTAGRSGTSPTRARGSRPSTRGRKVGGRRVWLPTAPRLYRAPGRRDVRRAAGHRPRRRHDPARRHRAQGLGRPSASRGR